MEDILAQDTWPFFFSKVHKKKKKYAVIVALFFWLAQRHCEEYGGQKSQQIKSKQQFRIKITSQLVDLKQICLRK